MERVEAPVTGSVWKVECAVGDVVEEGDVLLILESMKMEIPVEADLNGRVSELLCAEGDAVADGQPLLVLEP
jgi:acetyl-CoA carboxylase biotin carboxyl carrier protein